MSVAFILLIIVHNLITAKFDVVNSLITGQAFSNLKWVKNKNWNVLTIWTHR